MKNKITRNIILILLLIFFLGFQWPGISSAWQNEASTLLTALLPKVESWPFSESPQVYYPENLYEYIDGAAEIYLNYDFQQLAVGQYKKADSPASISVEIYDMGSSQNAFGIYSAERFPEAQFVPVGSQGYQEEGSLNFIIGRYYIKLLCFDCGQENKTILSLFAQNILDKVKGPKQLPLILQVFPRQGLIANSEKFILHNFLGYRFLHHGWTASYKVDSLEFECFVAVGESEDEAQAMLASFLKAKEKEKISRLQFGYHLQDRYYGHVYLTREGNYLAGVMKIKNGSEKTGEKYLTLLIQALKSYKK